MNDRRNQLITDPEVTGDLLLIGLVLDSLITDGTPVSIKQLHLLAYGPQGPRVRLDSEVREPTPRNSRGEPDWLRCRAAEVLRLDARRYAPPEPRDISCDAPTPRKPRCGKNHQLLEMHTDQATGERYYLAACSKHAAWFEQRSAQQGQPEVGKIPLPYANAGGRLARHIPELDWPGLWRRLNPTWEEHPERETSTPGAPKLSVLIGDDDHTAPAPVQVRIDDTDGSTRTAATRRRNRKLYALDGG